MYTCPDDTVAIPVHNQTWLEADCMNENAHITSKTDFLIVLAAPEVKKIANPPTPEQLSGILR